MVKIKKSKKYMHCPGVIWYLGCKGSVFRSQICSRYQTMHESMESLIPLGVCILLKIIKISINKIYVQFLKVISSNFLMRHAENVCKIIKSSCFVTPPQKVHSCDSTIIGLVRQNYIHCLCIAQSDGKFSSIKLIA